MLNSENSDTAAYSPNEKIIGALVFFTVALTTWAIAGRAGWVPPVFTGLAVLTAIVSVLVAVREGGGFHFRAFLPALLFLILVSISLLNPSYVELYGTGVWAPREGWLPWLPGTINREHTVSESLPWLAALLLGAALRQASFSSRGVRLLWGVLLVHGLLVAAVGVYFHITNRYLVLGVFSDPYGYHFSSFVYRNHWAAYVIILVSLSIGFSFSALRRWLAARRRFDAVLPGLCAAFMLALTLPIPGSRSGMIVVALLIGVAFARMGWMLWRARYKRFASPAHRIGVFGLILFLGVTAGIGITFNREEIQKHWGRTVTQMEGMTKVQDQLRLRFSRDTVAMAADRPIWGWGVGCFRFIFPKYQGDYFRDDQGNITARVHHAHNDWAEMFAELGLLGCLVLLIPVALRLRDIWRSTSVLFRWGGAAVVVILAYALVDFPLHNPAVLFLWVTILCTAGPRDTQISHP